MSAREETSPRWREALRRNGLDRLGALLRGEADQIGLRGKLEVLHKPGLGGRRRWRWTIEPEDAASANAGDANPPATLYIKRYADASPREQWDRLWRQCLCGGRACWEYQQSQRLAAAHINVPPAAGYAEEMHGPFESRGVVLLESVPGDGFDRVWSALSAENAPVTRGPARHEITARLARFAAAFHGTGCCHRDLYFCHIFADLDPQGSRPPRFTLIDLARTHYPRWRRMRWIIKDLAQLDASARCIGATRADRWRFLRAYLNLPARAIRVKLYARRIARKSDRILARDERKRARS